MGFLGLGKKKENTVSSQSNDDLPPLESLSDDLPPLDTNPIASKDSSGLEEDSAANATSNSESESDSLPPLEGDLGDVPDFESDISLDDIPDFDDGSSDTPETFSDDESSSEESESDESESLDDDKDNVYIEDAPKKPIRELPSFNERSISGPVFVRMNTFQRALSVFDIAQDEVEQCLEKADQVIEYINAEQKACERLQSDLLSINKKLYSIDGLLFENR